MSPDYKISSYGDTHTLYIPEVFDEDAGRFSVVSENDAGKATCSALLVVVDESQILPKDESPPETPQVKYAALGFGPPPVVPLRQPAPVQKPPPPVFKQEIIKPVAAPPVAAPPKPTPAPYQPVEVVIELPVPPEFIEPLKNLAAQEGTRVTFEGCVRGKPEPSIKWFKEGRQLTSSADFEITYQNGRVHLSIPEVFEKHGGRYSCSAQNKAGQVQSIAELVVKG